MFEFTFTRPCGCDADDPACTHGTDKGETTLDRAPVTDREADIWQGLAPVAPEDIAGCMATEFDDEENEPRGERKTFAEACGSEDGLHIFVTDDRIVVAHSDYGIYADDDDDPDVAEDGDARVHAVHQVDPDDLLTLLLVELHHRGVDVDALLAVRDWEEMETVLASLGSPSQGEVCGGGR